MGDLTLNFSRWEFTCRCGHLHKPGQEAMDPDFLQVLQEVRNYFRCPIQVISGFRCPLHDLTKKRPGSKHVRGIAADVVVGGVSPIKAAEYLFSVEHWSKILNGIGVNWRGGTLHLDTRPTEEFARWTYTFEGKLKLIQGVKDLRHARNDEARVHLV